jgi:hypothetical protein
MLNKNNLKSYIMSVITNNPNKWYNELTLYNEIKDKFKKMNLYRLLFIYLGFIIV